jgi:thiamine biosynthesis lipoprotein
MRLERFRFRAMGSPCALHLWSPSRGQAERGAERALAEIARLERKYSRYREDSLATRINRSAGSPCGVSVDEETAALLDFAATAHRESGGRFDPTSGVLRRVWDFRSGVVPKRAAIREALRRVGWHRIRWERPRLTLPVGGMELDWGGFVKEYAADRVAELCRSQGLPSGLVDLGGDLAVVGPHPDGTPWMVGIRNPRRPEHAMGRIALRSGGLATSGDYERFMIVDGVRYSHLLDPRTGESFRDGPASVSVAADHCLIAGVAATIAMLHEESESEQFLASLGLPHLGVTREGRIFGEARVVPDAVREPMQRGGALQSPSRLVG